MNNRSRWVLVLVFVVCSFGGFMVANAWQPGTPRAGDARDRNDPLRALGGWLRLMPDQFEEMEKVDPKFAAERGAMEAELAKERERLADLFEDATASNEDIMKQVDKVIEIHDRLERRVAGYLLALRPHLTAAQRAKLFQRCGEEVRSAAGWRRGYGGPPPGRGPGTGRGNGSNRGRGMGPPWAETEGQSGGGRGGPPRGGR